MRGERYSECSVEKYGNRWLYDTAESRYVTLEELAASVRAGAEVRVVDAQTGENVELGGERVAAFCGLANPTTFWSTLRGQEVVPLFRWTFGDHHSYRHAELVRLREHAKLQAAAVLLTTEKDLMNLPPNVAEMMAPVKVFWLRIGMEIEGEGELIEQIRAIL